MPTEPRHYLDAAGEACGTVTPAIRQALAQLPPGELLEVLTADPATRVGVPAWCRLTGHQLVDSREEDAGRTRFWIRRKSDPVPTA